MTFADGDRKLSLIWRTAPLSSWTHDLVQIDTVDLPVGPVTLYWHEGRGLLDSGVLEVDTYSAIWEMDGRTMALSSSPGMDYEQFRAAVVGVVAADVDTWLSSMSDSTVFRADQARVIDEMLADLPVPESFDPSSLQTTDEMTDRYQLGARVLSAVACPVFDQWAAAVVEGDAVEAERALVTLESAHEWPVLGELTARGGAYSEVLLGLVDNARSNGDPGEPGHPVSEAYRDALACPPPR